MFLAKSLVFAALALVASNASPVVTPSGPSAANLELTTIPTIPPHYNNTRVCTFDFLNDPTRPDENNYGDGECTANLHRPYGEQLIFSEILFSNVDVKYSRQFENVVVTSVGVLNFGRTHGSTRNVTIKAEDGLASVDAYVENVGKTGIRLAVQVLGYKL